MQLPPSFPHKLGLQTRSVAAERLLFLGDNGVPRRLTIKQSIRNLNER
jgi:hypothetical protein